MAETFYVNFVMGYSGNKQHSKIFYKFYSVTGDKVISFSHNDLQKFRFPGIGDEHFDGEEQGEDFGELHGEDAGDSDSEIEVVLLFLVIVFQQISQVLVVCIFLWLFNVDLFLHSLPHTSHFTVSSTCES